MQLNKNICSIIKTYLSYIENYALNLLYRDLFILPEFTQIIKDRLDNLKLNSNNFINAMIKHKLVISGSFVLATLYDEEYKNSDIDLYVVGEKDGFCFAHANECDKKCPLRSMYNEKCWDDINPNDQLNYHTIDSLDAYDILPIGARTYMLANAMINHIIIDPNLNLTCQEFIDKYFDLDFCKVSFDGKELKITNFTDVYNKTTHVSYKLDLYRRKSFGGANNPSDEYLKGLIDKRIEKYRNRGFTINVSEF